MNKLTYSLGLENKCLTISSTISTSPIIKSTLINHLKIVYSLEMFPLLWICSLFNSRGYTLVWHLLYGSYYCCTGNGASLISQWWSQTWDLSIAWFQIWKYTTVLSRFLYSYRTVNYFWKYFGSLCSWCIKGNFLLINQSATLLIAYFMKKFNWTFKKAIKFVRDKRPIVLPNLGF